MESFLKNKSKTYWKRHSHMYCRGGWFIVVVHLRHLRNTYLWTLDFSLMEGAHSLYTHTHIEIYWSFSQEGRISCQYKILLPLLSSPPYLCGMFLKMINCYFWICPLKVISHLTAFSGPVRPAITTAHVEKSKGSGLRRCRWLSNLQPGCQAWPCQSIFTSSASNVRGIKG